MQPAYISMAAAAKIANVTDPSTLRQAARRGTLQAVKMGRDWFTTEEWLAEYRKRGRTQVALDRWGLEAAQRDLRIVIEVLESLRTFDDLAAWENAKGAALTAKWKVDQLLEILEAREKLAGRNPLGRILEARDEPKG